MRIVPIIIIIGGLAAAVAVATTPARWFLGTIRRNRYDAATFFPSRSFLRAFVYLCLLGIFAHCLCIMVFHEWDAHVCYANNHIQISSRNSSPIHNNWVWWNGILLFCSSIGFGIDRISCHSWSVCLWVTKHSGLLWPSSHRLCHNKRTMTTLLDPLTEAAAACVKSVRFASQLLRCSVHQILDQFQHDGRLNWRRSSPNIAVSLAMNLPCRLQTHHLHARTLSINWLIMVMEFNFRWHALPIYRLSGYFYSTENKETAPSTWSKSCVAPRPMSALADNKFNKHKTEN